MNKELSNISNSIPLITIAAYFSGYFALSLHTTQYGPIENRLIDLQYLRTGILLLVLYGIPVISTAYHYSDRTDDFNKTKKVFPSVMHKSLEISWIAILVTQYYRVFDILQLPARPTSILILFGGFFIFSSSYFLWFYFTSYSARNISSTFRNRVYITATAIEAFYLLFFGNAAIFHYVLLSFVLVCTSFAYLGQVADKKAEYGSLFLMIPIFTLWLFSFSKNILPEVPPSFGGFKAPTVHLVFNPNDQEILRSLGINADTGDPIGPYELLAESDDSFIIETNLGYVQLKKDYIVSVITKKDPLNKAKESSSSSMKN